MATLAREFLCTKSSHSWMTLFGRIAMGERCNCGLTWFKGTISAEIVDDIVEAEMVQVEMQGGFVPELHQIPEEK